MKRAIFAFVLAIIAVGCDDSQNSGPPSKITAGQTAATAQADSLRGRLDVATLARTKAAKALSDAKQQAVNRLSNSPEYIAAKQDADTKAQAYEVAKRGGSLNERMDKGSVWNLALAKLTSMESNAIKGDGPTTAAKIESDAAEAAYQATLGRWNQQRSQDAAASQQKFIQEEANKRAEHNDIVAFAGLGFAKKIVPLALKAPASAEFPDDQAVATPMADYVDQFGARASQWRVIGPVDASNSFGAKLRSRWEIIVLEKDGELFPRSASVDGQAISLNLTR